MEWTEQAPIQSPNSKHSLNILCSDKEHIRYYTEKKKCVTMTQWRTVWEESIGEELSVSGLPVGLS